MRNVLRVGEGGIILTRIYIHIYIYVYICIYICIYISAYIYILKDYIEQGDY